MRPNATVPVPAPTGGPRLALMLAALALAGAPPAGADIIRLKNGARLEGKAQEQTGQMIIETDEGGYIRLHRDQVAGVSKGPTPKDLFLYRLAGVEPEDVRGRYELGLWCRRNGLYLEASDVFQQILDVDPDHAGAREELGYQRVGDEWLRGAWTSTESDHFVIRHNTPAEAARAALDVLEAFHAAFQRAFCPPLRFNAVHKVRVTLFNRRDEYLEHVQDAFPQFAGRADTLDRFPRAFTESPSRRILCYFEKEETAALLHTVLLHEATHALLSMAREAAVRSPAWFEEAFADYLASSSVRGGAVGVGQGVTESPLFRWRMAQAREALEGGRLRPLRDLLSRRAFDVDDPGAADLYAQSLSFLYHLLTRESAAKPLAFREYLAAAAEGKGGVDAIERILGAPVEAVEKRWQASLLEYRPTAGPPGP
jgi:hypothetical protein